MSFHDVLKIFRHFWLFCACATLVGAGLAAALSIAGERIGNDSGSSRNSYTVEVVSALLTPVASAQLQRRLAMAESFVSSATAIWGSRDGGELDLSSDQALAESTPELLSSRTVLDSAAREMGTTIAEIRDRVSVSVSPGTNLINISSTGNDSASAADFNSRFVAAVSRQVRFGGSVGTQSLSVINSSVADPIIAPDLSDTAKLSARALLAKDFIAQNPMAVWSAGGLVQPVINELLASMPGTDPSLGPGGAPGSPTLSINAEAQGPYPTTGTAGVSGIIAVTASGIDQTRVMALAYRATRALQTQVSAMPGLGAGSAPPLVVVGITETRFASPKSPLMNSIALGALLGFLAALAFAAIRVKRDQRIRSVGRFLEAGGSPPIGIIASATSAAPVDWHALDTSSSVSECYRSLRSNLILGSPERRVIAVTSPDSHEGPISIGINLAIALAQVDLAVALIDASPRHPSLAAKLGLDESLGLTNVLRSQSTLDQALQTWSPHGIAVLCAGPGVSNPSEVLSSPQFVATLAELRSSYDYVICITEPLLGTTDAAVVSSRSDGTLLVVQVGQTTTDQMQAALTVLGQVAAPYLGVVISAVPEDELRRWQSEGQIPSSTSGTSI